MVWLVSHHRRGLVTAVENEFPITIRLFLPHRAKIPVKMLHRAVG